MGLEHNTESAEAHKSDSADSANFAAGLSAQLWSSDTTKIPVAKTAGDSSPASLTIVALADTAKDSESKPTDATAGKIQKESDKTALPEANQYLFQAAKAAENQSIYKLPKWGNGLPKPSPDLGCVSSFTNRYREALRLAGVIDSTDSKDYRNLTQVNMDELNKVMGVSKTNPQEQLMKKIDPAEVKEGDILEARNPGTTSRHMGIVGGIENGKRVIYNNYGGIWRKEAIDDRFGRYKEWTFYRAYLPPKK